MAWGTIDLASIARSQDYTTIKQNEDNKGVAMQNNLVNMMQKEEEHKAAQVNEAVKADWLNKKFDAKEKGSNEYHGQENEKKKDKDKEDRVIVKDAAHAHAGFDIKI